MLRYRSFCLFYIVLSLITILLLKYKINQYQFIKRLRDDSNIATENIAEDKKIQAKPVIGNESQNYNWYTSKATRSNLVINSRGTTEDKLADNNGESDISKIISTFSDIMSHNSIKKASKITKTDIRAKIKETLKDSRKFMKNGNTETPLLPIRTNDGSQNITDIFFKTIKTKIMTELSNYDFHYSGVSQLTDLIMEAGGRPLTTLIISTWRSGSSFLGGLLNAMPGNFYYYEPFRFYESKQIHYSHVKQAIKTIRNLFKCSYDSNAEYFKWAQNDSTQMLLNEHLWNHSVHNREIFSDPDLLSRACKLFPFLTMKLVRFRLECVEELLQDKELSLKVILLIRDPRAVMQSRKHVQFCSLSPDCFDPKVLCKDMVSDYIAAARFLQNYPERIMVLRFEEFISSLKNNTQKLLKFLRLRETPQILNFLNTHTNVKSGNNYSTFRITKDVPFRWKNILDFEYVEYIQTECFEAMKLWGYKAADNATYMKRKDFNPLEPCSITL